MTNEDGLIFAFTLDGKGGGRPLDWTGVSQHWDNEEVVWAHLDYSRSQAQEWVREKSGLDPVTCEALLSNDTRPRSVCVGDGLLLILRGVNLNPGADPKDMVSLHLWIEHHRLITLRHDKLRASEDVRQTGLLP